MKRDRANPVYKREMTVRSRSLRAPVILLIFNGILALVTLVNMYMAVSRARVSASIEYSSFIELYGFAATLEFLLLVAITPAMTAGSISGERERKTLELLFTTRMSPSDIVVGKLMSTLVQLAVLIISSVPIIFITFVYGSVRLKDFAALMICFAVTALLSGTVGIFFSSFMKRSTVSNVCTYLTLAVIIAGTIVFYVLSLGEGMRGSGGAVYLLLINPAVTFAQILGTDIEGAARLISLSGFNGSGISNFVTEHWILVSIAVQTAVSLLLTWGAIILINPKRHSKNTRRR